MCKRRFSSLTNFLRQEGARVKRRIKKTFSSGFTQTLMKCPTRQEATKAYLGREKLQRVLSERVPKMSREILMLIEYCQMGNGYTIWAPTKKAYLEAHLGKMYFWVGKVTESFVQSFVNTVNCQYSAKMPYRY